MTHRLLLAAAISLLAGHAIADEPRKYIAGRGEMLYSVHCVACHTSQVHWRDKKLATDWRRLQAEVRHWEGFARLDWTDDDVVAVARYLNAMHYRFAVPD